MKKKAVLFVHGLNGSRKTWGDFKEFIENDPSLDYEVFYYEYPSSWIRIIPFLQDKYASPRALAGGLKTYIDTVLSEFNEIVLVGHSLGGVLIKKYLVDSKISEQSNRNPLARKIKKVMFYAVPQEGSGLANASSAISFGHGHLKQLGKNSEFLDTLNDSWAISQVENDYEIRLVIAAEDAVVTEYSAKANFRHAAIEFIPGKGHKSISKPTGPDDLSFLVLKKFLLESINIGKNRPNGALVYDEFLSKDGSGPFFPDERRKAAIGQLCEAIVKPRNIVRIIGLSGLGKTRTVLEAVRLLSDENKRSLIYIDDASESGNLVSVTNDWISAGVSGIFIVDNCSVSLHDKLLKAVKRPESNISLLTIDSDLQTSGECSYIELGRLSDEMIKAILVESFGDALQDIDRIASFAQGFPQMAVLIAKARINLEATVGRLDDDHIAHKLLWGEAGENREDERILRGCALFDRFGLEHEAARDFEYIAEHVVQIEKDDFYDCVKRFVERGIIDQRGRYVQLVPKPLAIRLAAQWWARNPPDKHALLIKGMPDTLITSFCDQIGRLDFLPEVKEFTNTLCGFQGPFGQAEVILSSRGSRFFRAFVEVNPDATSGALSRILTQLDIHDRHKIDNDVRRNLVWSLEKLCFHARTFEESAWSLFLLSEAENETWGNNATGIFAQLFRTQLSGTEAAPPIRFSTIQKALEQNSLEADLVIIAAAEQMINVRGGTRTVGAEYQGTRAPLQEWRAAIWQEIFDVWQFGIDTLVSMLQRGEQQKDKSLTILGHSIRIFILKGRIEMLDGMIRRVIDIQGKYWPAGLDGLKTSLEYDNEGIPADAKAAVITWLELLNPKDSTIGEKLQILVTNPPWEHRDTDEGYVDVAAENARAFAMETLPHLSSLAPYIEDLSTGEQKQAYVFGQTLAQSGEIVSLLEKAMVVLRDISNPNLSFSLGILNGIYQRSQREWEAYIAPLPVDEILCKFYPHFIASGSIQSSQLEVVNDLYSQGKVAVISVSSLAYGSVLNHLSPDEVSRFCLDLARCDDIAAWTAFEILYMYCRSEGKTIDACKSVLIIILSMLELSERRRTGRIDMHAWNDVVRKLIETEESDFSSMICKVIVASAKGGMDHNDMWHYIKPCLTKIFKIFGSEVWPIFSEAIAQSKGMESYWLKELLERENSLALNQPSLFSVLPQSLVIGWCEENPDKYPSFVAACLDVLHGNTVNPLAIALLEHFGSNPNLGPALSASMSSRGWSGSLVPYLEADLAAVSSIVEHQNAYVRAWASQKCSYLKAEIASESMRDAEDTL
jgi:hypothetical protein